MLTWQLTIQNLWRDDFWFLIIYYDTFMVLMMRCMYIIIALCLQLHLHPSQVHYTQISKNKHTELMPWFLVIKISSIWTLVIHLVYLILYLSCILCMSHTQLFFFFSGQHITKATVRQADLHHKPTHHIPTHKWETLERVVKGKVLHDILLKLLWGAWKDSS